jgi:hypothetical protein
MNNSVEINLMTTPFSTWASSGVLGASRSRTREELLREVDGFKADRGTIDMLPMLVASQVGSRADTLRLLGFPDGTAYARTGCFLGTLEEFEAAVWQTYTDQTNIHRLNYDGLITAFRLMHENWRKKFGPKEKIAAT